MRRAGYIHGGEIRQVREKTITPLELGQGRRHPGSALLHFLLGDVPAIANEQEILRRLCFDHDHSSFSSLGTRNTNNSSSIFGAGH
jgi:hypothetical protein